MDYKTQISDDLNDSEWDDFVVINPGSHHVQTSMWSQIKFILGWRVTRIIVKHQGRIIAGCQLLIRTIPLIGSIGYITKGPLCTIYNPETINIIMSQVHHLSRKLKLKLIAIQPPNNGQITVSQLSHWKFKRSSLELAPTATILLDLKDDTDKILGQMKRQTRQNIRRSVREGIRVREGTEDDLDIFYKMHLATSKRQDFRPYPLEYFKKMWNVLEPQGNLKLLIAEYEAEAISSLLIIPFKDTVIAKILGWSGLYPERRPNEAVFWASILWAKSHGYCFFDFEGINPKNAILILNGEPLPERFKHSPDFFKLGFGGKVVLYPEAYDKIINPLLSWIFRRISPEVGSRSISSKIIDFIRKR